ncbi:MAG: protein-export chaperone SecB, partial [Clostridia bacterium]|nr:protein-export chaperone SecB [Clostridia bacterium]
MKEFELKSYKIQELQFVNTLDRPTKLELNYQYSYNVGYSNHNSCRGDFKAVIADKKLADKFSLTIVVSGIFDTAEGIAKEILHVKTYDALFPYVKALVSSFTASASIPPIFIPYID